MAKTCPQCKYYSANNDESECPKCHVELRLTLLGPANEPPPATQQEIVPVEPERPRSKQGFFKGNEPSIFEQIMRFRFYLLVGGLILGAVLMLARGGIGGGDVYDRLKIGMKRQEVEAIVNPSGRRQTIVADNMTLTLNNQMVLVLQDGILVEKRRLGAGQE